MTLWSAPALAQEPPQAPPTPKERELVIDPSAAMRQAQDAYQRAEYAKIRPLLRPTLEPEVLYKDAQERIEARTLLAAGAFFEAQATRDVRERDALLGLSRAQLLALLREKPDHTLDTLVYPVSFIDLFEDVRTTNREELDLLRAKQNDPNGQGNPNGQVQTLYIERAVNQHHYALNFAPFGIGQFQNGHEIKGTLFAVTQGMALTLNIISYFAILSLRGTQDSDVYYDTGPDGFSGNYAAALTWRNVMYTSMGVFGALYAWSTIDALYYYEAQSLQYLRTLEQAPPELTPGPQNHMAAPTLWLKWRLEF